MPNRPPGPIPRPNNRDPAAVGAVSVLGYQSTAWVPVPETFDE